MAQPLPQHLLEEYDIVEVAAAWTEAVNNLVTEDDKPVDNLFSAKQQRLLARTLYSSWTPLASEDAPEEKRKFLADANVGVFYSPHHPATGTRFLSEPGRTTAPRLVCQGASLVFCLGIRESPGCRGGNCL